MRWSELYRPLRLVALALVLGAGLGVGALSKARPAGAAYDTRPDLQISMTAQPDPYPYRARAWIYTITVSNPGHEGEWDPETRRIIEYPLGGTAAGVVVHHYLPVQAFLESASGTNGFTCGFMSGGMACTGGRIPRGGTATITVRFRFYPDCPFWSWSTRAVVDPANAIAERDEANNTAQDSHIIC